MHQPSHQKIALITGGAKRLGAAIGRVLHNAGMNVVVHYRSSAADAEALCAELNQLRGDSCAVLQADLLDYDRHADFLARAVSIWNGLDALVNNASAFFPSPAGNITEAHWDTLIGTNMKAPFFLAQAAAPILAARRGCIINMVDIHGERPLKNYPVYSISKAGMAAVTGALAKELGPEIRVNGVSPGAILWPEGGVSDQRKKEIISRITLQRIGCADDIARCVLFLIRDADYVTGQIVAVDGGRRLFS